MNIQNGREMNCFLILICNYLIVMQVVIILFTYARPFVNGILSIRLSHL